MNQLSRAGVRTILFLIVVSIFGLAQASAQHQGNIKGKVVDKKNNNPLVDATVTIRGLNKATTTDKDGKYEFNSLEADKNYTLEMSKVPLYKDDSTTVNVKPNKTVDADDVMLEYEGLNVNKMRELVELYEARRYGELSLKLDTVAAQCTKVKEEDCKLIVETNKAFDKDKLLATDDAMRRIEKLISKQNPLG